MGMVAMRRIYFPSELPDEYYVIARAPYDLQYGYAWYAINFDANQNKFLITNKLLNHEI
jgi:hypothetical protein